MFIHWWPCIWRNKRETQVGLSSLIYNWTVDFGPKMRTRFMNSNFINFRVRMPRRCRAASARSNYVAERNWESGWYIRIWFYHIFGIDRFINSNLINSAFGCLEVCRAASARLNFLAEPNWESGWDVPIWSVHEFEFHQFPRSDASTLPRC